MAIYEACQFFLTNYEDLRVKYLKIYSVSQAAIKALHNMRIKSKYVSNVLEAMETLASKINIVQLVWVKAHLTLKEMKKRTKRQKKARQRETQIGM